jgi:Mn-dependent DtxR family transcriptional regulator
MADDSHHQPTFLTNHALTLIEIAANPAARTIDIAEVLGITERRVQGIVADLTAVGYIAVTKDGHRNHYEIDAKRLLRDRMGCGCNVGDLIRFLLP